TASAPAGVVLPYEFRLYRDAALTLPLPGASLVPETPGHTGWTVQSTLAENERYWWRGRAGEGFSNTPWAAVASFLVDAANEPPTSPMPDSPRPDARVATLQPDLVGGNAHDPESDALLYDFRLATDPGMTQLVASVAGVTEGPAHTRWTVPIALVEDAHYYWSARARDAHAASAWTQPISFQVDVSNESPSAVALVAPAPDAEVATVAPTLVIGPATDPEGDALTYRIEVDRVPTF